MSKNYNKFFGQNNRGERQNTNPVDEVSTLNQTSVINPDQADKPTNNDSFNETSPENQNLNVNQKGVVANCSKLNLREKPNLNAGVITILNLDTELLIMEIVDGWVNVCTPEGLEGYVMEEYIKIK